MSKEGQPLEYIHVETMAGTSFTELPDDDLDRRSSEMTVLVRQPEKLTPRQLERVKQNLGYIAFEQWSRFQEDEGNHIEMHRRVSGSGETVLWLPEYYEPNPEAIEA